MWTVVTPSVCRETVFKIKEILKEETVKYQHLIMLDEKRESDIDPKEFEDDVTFVYEMKHNLHREPPHKMDVYLRAVGITMSRTPFVRCCDDDVFPEPGHLTKVTEFMTSNNLDFCWCYRRMLDRDGNVLGIDTFEAIGEKNQFGYNLLDNSSLFMNQKAARIASQVFLSFPYYGDDRYTWEPLQRYCKGMMLKEVLTNHMAQPHLTDFFKKNCTPE